MVAAAWPGPCTSECSVVTRKGARDTGPGGAGSPDDANPGAVRSAAPFVPRSESLRTLATAAAGCRGCDLYKTATQVVFGEGPRKARVLFVGEQPGDQEDLQGHP